LCRYDGKKHKSQPRKTAGKEVPLSEVVEVKRGHATATFWAAVSTRGRDGVAPDDRCFSLEADDRSVDCGCPDPQTADAFLAALERALRFFDSRGAAPPPEFEDMEGGHENNLPYNEAENKPRLFAAVKRDDLNEVERHFVSLNCPVDIMEDYSGDTVLLASCRMGRITIVQVSRSPSLARLMSLTLPFALASLACSSRCSTARATTRTPTSGRRRCRPPCPPASPSARGSCWRRRRRPARTWSS
jgi:hypothetical protein